MKSLKNDNDDFRDPQRKSFSPLNIAGPWRRLCAQIIDLGIVGLCTTWAMVFWFPSRLFTAHWWAAHIALTIYVSLLTQIIFLYVYGNTLGKKLMNLKIQSARPKQSVTPLQIIQRCLSWWAGVFSFGTTWTTILSLNDRRAWHDLVSETVVVNQVTGQEKNADLPSRNQKNVSVIWMCASFVSFVLVLIFTLLYEFRALRSGQLTISDDAFKIQKERSSWYLLTGDNSPPNTKIIFKNKDEEVLNNIIKLFGSGRDLSPLSRHEFYKANIEANENFLCRPGKEISVSCQSAQAINQLLNADIVKTLHPGSLEGLRLLEKVEAQNRLPDQINVLEAEAGHWEKTSFEYAMLNQAKANLLMKAGNFEDAKQVLKMAAQTAPALVVGSINENLCQSEALTDCQFKQRTTCLDNPYWKAWSAGCSAAVEPKDYTLSSEILGYWWGQAHTRKSRFENLSSWEKVKERYGTVNPAKIDPSEGVQFEKYVIAALDFVLNIKTSNPDDLIGKSKNLGFGNPLWGWAQTEAIKEFGEQWTFLIHPSEKNLIARYNLMEKTNAFMVAAHKKANSVTQASTESRAGESRAGESRAGEKPTSQPEAAGYHHSAGARTQESR